MQLSYYLAAALRITGSEESATHVGTLSLDQALNSTNPINDPWMYAPFDMKIWRIYAASNGMFLTSVEPVQTPTFVDYVSFYIGHMNDDVFLPMNYTVGQVIKQGQKFYREGIKGYATGEHVHLNFGRGTFTGNGWAKATSGNWGITTTGGEVHLWDAMYLKTGMQKFAGTSAASGYPWVYEPIPATMKAVSDMSIINNSSSNINIRWKPSTKFSVVGKIPSGTKMAISEKSTNEADGYFWVGLADGTGYSAIISDMQVIDEAAERLAAEQEAARLAAIEEAEKAAEAARLAEEATAKAAAEEEARLAAIHEAIRLSAEKAAADALEADRLAKEAAARLAAEEALKLQIEAERQAAALEARKKKERELAMEAVRQEKLKEHEAEQALLRESIDGKVPVDEGDATKDVQSEGWGLIIKYLIKIARGLAEYLRSK